MCSQLPKCSSMAAIQEMFTFLWFSLAMNASRTELLLWHEWSMWFITVTRVASGGFWVDAGSSCLAVSFMSYVTRPWISSLSVNMWLKLKKLPQMYRGHEIIHVRGCYNRKWSQKLFLNIFARENELFSLIASSVVNNSILNMLQSTPGTVTRAVSVSSEWHACWKQFPSNQGIWKAWLTNWWNLDEKLFRNKLTTLCLNKVPT